MRADRCSRRAAARRRGAEDPPSTADRIEELQQDLDSLIEDVEDLQEPVEEFDLFDECSYLIGVSEYGGPGRLDRLRVRTRRRAPAPGAGARHPRLRPARPIEFLAFPAEEPPSIECNEDAGEEDSDD